MSQFTKVVNWGQALHLEAIYGEGGLAGAVDRIHASVGKSFGTRNTYKKLFSFEDVPTAEKERERAVLLLLALGQEPRNWGLGDVHLPPAINTQPLIDLGKLSTGCFSALAA